MEDIDGSLATPASDDSLDERLADAHKTAAADFAQAIGAQAADATVGNALRGVPGRGQTPSVRNATEGVPYSPDTHPGNAQGHSGDPPSGKAPAGIVVTNPLGFSRRVCVDVSGLDCLPDVAGAVLLAGEEAGRKSVVAEVPPLGFVCVVPGSGRAAVKAAPRRFGLFRKRAATRHPDYRIPAGCPPVSTLGPGRLPMAELVASAGGAVLRNEFFELAIDPHTGAVRSVFDFHSRAPRLAQQVAMRLPGAADEEDAYSIMAADEIRVLAAGPVVGEVLVRGRLVDRGGQPLAGFQQSTARYVGQPRDRGGNPTRSPAPTGRRPLEFVLCGSIRLGAGCADALSQRESSDRCDRRRASGIAALHRDSRRGRAHDDPHGGPALSLPSRPAETRFAVDRAGRDGPAIPPGHRHRPGAADGRGLGFRGPVAAGPGCGAAAGTTRPGFSISIRAR